MRAKFQGSKEKFQGSKFFLAALEFFFAAFLCALIMVPVLKSIVSHAISTFRVEVLKARKLTIERFVNDERLRPRRVFVALGLGFERTYRVNSQS